MCVGFVFFRFVGAAQSETLAWSAAVDFLLLPVLLLGFLFSLRSFVLARRDVGLTYTLTDDVAGVVVTVTGRGDDRRFATSDLVAIQQAFGARPPNQRWRFVFCNGQCDVAGDAGDQVGAIICSARPDVMVMPYNEWTGDVV